MSMASSTFSPSNVIHGFTPCYCGLPSRIRTSRTYNNPGRKFMICPKAEGRCAFWEWVEPDETIEAVKCDILSLRKEPEEIKKKQFGVKLLLVVFLVIWLIGLLK